MPYSTVTTQLLYKAKFWKPAQAIPNINLMNKTSTINSSSLAA